MARSRTKGIFAHILSQNVTRQEELQRGPVTGVLLSHIPVTLSRYSLSLKVSFMVENKDDVTVAVKMQ